ncbi:TIGR04222 domain-containing membrane protein [Lentzea sp. PSKA42]|uniref:TIGR04222 domain-containing membrane protein n=1 Tax=Lentzea indica TaxID=2604800 RepID=A0ABX1FD91_9PSEU|nr:TIGR04222 domain-containing membrane protein [Lentzea indica]NKE56608.1 TIGR04222 domain-containing membrane protein [Lentzea indica]
MAKPSTAAVMSVEEIGFLAGGPGRAVEAALARLMDGGLVRISREGLVTAVYQNGYGATTALEAYILSGLHGTARPIPQVVQVAMGSQEMGSLRHSLTARAMVRRKWGKAGGGTRAFRTLLILLAIASAISAIAFDGKLIALTVVLLFLTFLMRNKGRVTTLGKSVLLYAMRYPRGDADVVALHGLRRGGQRTRKSSSDSGGCGGGCSSSYDYSHHSCAGSSSNCSSSSSSSCSSSSSSCSSSSSSCSSSSSSSCSSSSSS